MCRSEVNMENEGHGYLVMFIPLLQSLVVTVLHKWNFKFLIIYVEVCLLKNSLSFVFGRQKCMPVSGWNKYIYQDRKKDVIKMKSLYDALNTFNLMSPISLLWGMLNLCLCAWRNYGRNQKMLFSRKFPLDKVLGGKFTSLTVVFACLLKCDKVCTRRERYSFLNTIQSSSGAQIAKAHST